MTYTFNTGPVAAVGGFINYAPGFGPNVTIEALDAGNNVLESYDITVLAPISTPSGTNAGEFRGIVRGTADIVAFRVSKSFVVLDDLRFSQQAVPALPPAALAALALLLLAAGFWALRRQRAAA